MSYCPESEYRSHLTDAEFWEHVFFPLTGGSDYDIEEPYDELVEELIGTPCPECGSINACGYDQEGRPMIHVINEEH